MFPRIAAVAAIMLAGWTTAAAADGDLSVVLTSVKGTTSSGGQTCTISAEVNNGTANHLDRLTANATMFNIDIRNLRAYARYEFTFHSQESCSQVVAYIRSKPDFATIDRCDMPSVREGDCLRVVNITSTISPADGARADTAAKAADTAAKSHAEEALTLAASRYRVYCQASHACLLAANACRFSPDGPVARNPFPSPGFMAAVRQCQVDCSKPSQFPDGPPPLPAGHSFSCQMNRLDGPGDSAREQEEMQEGCKARLRFLHSSGGC
jgi:hypothetical protein